MPKYIAILLLFFGTTPAGLAQQQLTGLSLDSLKQILLVVKDTERVNILNTIAGLHYNQTSNRYDSNLTLSGEFANKAVQLSKQINYSKGTGLALLNLGKVLSYREILHNAIETFTEATAFLKDANENKLFGDCLNNLAQCIHELGNNQRAIQYYDSSFAVFQKLKDTSGLILNLAWKGHSYFDMGDYKNAYKYGHDAAELAQKKGDTLAQIHAADHLANLFLGAGMPEIVLEQMRIITQFYPTTFTKPIYPSSWEVYWGLLKAGEAYLQLGLIDSAMQVGQILGFYPGDADGDMFFGHLFSAKKKYYKALPYFKNGFELSNTSDHAISLARHANGLARIYLATGNFDSALQYANKAAETAQKIHALLEMKNALGTLVDIYDTIKSYSKAYRTSKLYKIVSDSLVPEEYKRKLALIQIQQELESRKQQAQLLNVENKINQQQIKIQNSSLKRKSLLLYIFIAASLMLVLLGLLITRNIKLKGRKKQLQQLMEQVNAQQKLTELEKEKANLEMQALRAQMNPHFIFNCLSSINRFILINKIDEASDYLTKFSRLIRMALHNSEKSLITLESELEALRLYLDLERLRFKNAFNYSITFINAIDINAVYIPPMLIQPFAENAIWHGLMHKKGIGCLEIELCAEDKTLTCVIMDNGIGRKTSASLNSRSAEKNKSMGVEITAGRLALLNKSKEEDAVFNIEDLFDEEGNGCGTKVILTMPYKDLTEVVA